MSSFCSLHPLSQLRTSLVMEHTESFLSLGLRMCVFLPEHDRHMDLPHLEVNRDCEKIESLWQEIIRGNFLEVRKKELLLEDSSLHQTYGIDTVALASPASWMVDTKC